MEQLRLRLETQRTKALAAAAEGNARSTNLKRELDALGPAPENPADESEQTALDRQELRQELNGAEATRLRAERMAARTSALLDDLAALGKRNFIARLTQRGPSPLGPLNWVDAHKAFSDFFGRYQRETQRGWEAPSQRFNVGAAAIAAFVAISAGLIMLIGVRRFVLRFLSQRAAEAGVTQRILFGLGLSFSRFVIAGLSAVMILTVIAVFANFGQIGERVLRELAHGTADFIVVYVFAALIYSPLLGDMRLYNITEAETHRGFQASLLVGLALTIDTILQGPLSLMPDPDAANGIITFIVILVGAAALFRILRIETRRFEGGEDDSSMAEETGVLIRRFAIVICLVAPLLALIGYSFAARYIFVGTVQSLAVIAIGYVIYAVIRASVDSFLTSDDGRTERLRLIPIFVGFLLVCAITPLLALIWGASWLDLHAFYEVAAAGLVIGEVVISPIDFITFALVFGAIYTITRAAQRVMSVSVLPRMGVAEGASASVVSGIGYVGVFIAGLAAITATGIDLSNLAIVFGALSVGIGFGLQNIVNNFVSGVILLVERPIKVGDWIDVGGNQGYVKKVNVRSTVIETFDRSDYIVPNSDLISSPVLNYTLENKLGRVIVPVGVAYGSDADAVQRILLEVGRAHPMVVRNPSPAAYFLNFGADALEFELRVYLRDVNWMLSVKSDLNFRIYNRLKEEGIEIPFPQRDLHIKNPEALQAAFRPPAQPGDGET